MSLPPADPDHQHDGVYEITWEDFGGLCRELAMRIWREYQPEVVVGVAKGGVIVGATLSSALRRDFLPIKLSSRHDEKVVHEKPVWFVPPTDHVTGKRVLLVDDMCVNMVTLGMAREALLAKGAAEVRTATLMIHGYSQRPDWWAVETDALILVPWDLEVIENGRWILHPEFQSELDEMGMSWLAERG
jgi:hypothetical protein